MITAYFKCYFETFKPFLVIGRLPEIPASGETKSLMDIQVPLVSSNLRPEEAYVQLLDSLRYLEQVSDDVFSRIEQKASEQQLRLQSVNKRLAAADAKISHIRGSKKAIRVFAAPSFPAGKKSVYTSITCGESPAIKEPLHSNVVIRTKFSRDVKPPQKVEILPLVAASDLGLHFDEPPHDVGLGKLPSVVHSVNSLLLFNTDQNPYSRHIAIDPLGGTGKSRRLAEPEVQVSSLDAAPASFTQLDGNQVKDDLSYIPGFGDVPEFVLPNVLPDLPGVVEDFGFGDFSDDFGGSIPAIGGFTLDTPVQKTAPELPKVAVPQAPVRPAVSSLPPIPGAPPPPAPPTPVAASVGPKPPAPPPPPPPASAGPPPPPMPNAAAAPEPAAAGSAPPAGDARSSLMESIRAAGGSGKAKLKNVKERKLEQKKKKQEEKTKATSGGGDLMDDLKSRLTNLRKGISAGKKGGDEEGSTPSRPPSSGFNNAAMNRVSALIPHSPTMVNKPQESNEEWSD